VCRENGKFITVGKYQRDHFAGRDIRRRDDNIEMNRIDICYRDFNWRELFQQLVFLCRYKLCFHNNNQEGRTQTVF
jgi:hypothetical protein